jgi:hypothetical protein
MPRRKARPSALKKQKGVSKNGETIAAGRRIPAELWSAAVEVARKEGINRTARQLHAAWDDLKRRMETQRGVPLQPGSPAFVELLSPPVPSVPEYTLEVEGHRQRQAFHSVPRTVSSIRQSLCHLRDRGASHAPCGRSLSKPRRRARS